MALKYSIFSPIMLQKPKSTIRPDSKFLVRANNHVAVSITSIENGSSPRMKIFEDQSEGIVCYRDSNGEITCEGYDEGPRLERKISRFSTCNTRKTERVDFLQSWFQLVDGDAYTPGITYVNGFNELC